MNETGPGSYLFHLRKAANWDHIAAAHERKGFHRRADEARAEAQKHRDKAALIELEQRIEAA